MTMAIRQIGVLLVDDSMAMLAGLGKVIESDFPRMTLIASARTHEEALLHADRYPDVIVLDLALNACSSIETIPELKRRSGGRVLIHTGLGDQRLHEDAILFGAMGVVSKAASAATILQAIKCVHRGTFWNLAPSLPSTQNREENALRPDFAALGIDFLSPAERNLIADIVTHWQASPPETSRAPIVLGRLISIYNKLGLRNRSELVRFAIEHGIAGASWQSCQTPAGV